MGEKLSHWKLIFNDIPGKGEYGLRNVDINNYDGSPPMTVATATIASNARSRSNSAKSLVRKTGFNRESSCC
jgi:hypothetical protein